MDNPVGRLLALVGFQLLFAFISTWVLVVVFGLRWSQGVEDGWALILWVVTAAILLVVQVGIAVWATRNLDF